MSRRSVVSLAADLDGGDRGGGLERVVVKQLVDEVDVRQQHAAAAVAVKAQRGHRGAVRCREIKKDTRDSGANVSTTERAWRCTTGERTESRNECRDEG